MGKYDEVMKDLKKIQTPRSERVRDIMKQYADYTASNLAALWADARKRKKEAEKVVSGINEQLEAFAALMEGAYESEDITSMKIKSTGESVGLQHEPYLSIEDRDAFNKWCREHGYENEMTLNWQTANAIGKELLLAGEDVPDGTSPWIRAKFVLRKK